MIQYFRRFWVLFAWAQFSCSVLAIATLPTVANADFDNGDFETGDTTAWTIAPGPNAEYLFDDVLFFDIDGFGPKLNSQVLALSVGQISYEPGVYRHVDITQELQLDAGTTYEISFDWAVQNFFVLDNFDGGDFELIINDQPFANFDTQSVFANGTEYGTLSTTYSPVESGLFTVGARINRRFPIPAPDANDPILLQYVDNFSARPTAVPEPSSVAILGLLSVGTMGGLILRKARKVV